MNRSTLIVMCDFLLLSFLALISVDSEEAPTPNPARTETVNEVAPRPSQADQDMIEALKRSLQEAQESKDDLADDLDLTQRELQEREETLAEREARLAALAADLERREAERRRLEAEREALEEKVAETQIDMQALADERVRQEEAARRARERALEMERELREKLALLEDHRERVEELEGLRREAEVANQRLATELELSESEKRLIRENLEHARTEVLIAREEKARVQEQARELAQGVTLLAERSGELVQEVRGSQPKTSATIFTEFQENRLEARFSAMRNAFLGPVYRSNSPGTILVGDGERVYAIFHLEQTGLSTGEIADWERISGRLVVGDRQPLAIREISFLSIDPRIAVVPVNPATAETLGVKIYPLAHEPFRFHEAVLINNNGTYYGESKYTVDAEQDRYLRMPSRILSRLFGEFSPSTGDLVFSKTGEIIGIMVNNEYCAVIDNFLLAADMNFGIEMAPTSPVLQQIKDRVERLPARLRN